MRQSDNKTGYTQVDHVTFDVILPMLSTAAQAVFLRIYRQTVGWGKPYDEIANSQFRSLTGIKAVNTIRVALQELMDLHLIVSLGSRTERRSYGINWDTISGFAKEIIEDEPPE